MAEQQVIADLIADGAAIDALVAEIEERQWQLPTPAPGWTVAHQVGHLAFIFRIAGMAAGEPAAFVEMTSNLGAPGAFDAAVNGALAGYVNDPPSALLARWRSERDEGVKALAAVPAGQVVPWLVRPLPMPVLAAAGMMEMFGHGQDIADALGVRRERTDRIKHIVGFAVHTWDFGYQSRGLTPPDVQFRFELVAPSGATWVFGPADAEQKITGNAADVCLLVTRRRHRDDLQLRAIGADADQWLDIAQAYRGPAGDGRQRGQFSGS